MKASNQIIQEIQQWVENEARKGRIHDIDTIERKLKNAAEKSNSTPRAEFDGLTPKQMYLLRSMPFVPGSPVELRQQKTEQDAARFPLMRQFLFLIRLLEKQDIKLTKNGWLPLKVVAEGYPLGVTDPWVDRSYKRISEFQALSLQTAHILLEVMRLVRVAKGTMSLTRKGRDLLKDPMELYNKPLFYLSFFLNYPDFLSEPDSLFEDTNHSGPFLLYLLHTHGNEVHDEEFYARLYRKGISCDDEDAASFVLLALHHVCLWLGIVEMVPDKPERILNMPFKATPLLDALYYFNKD